MCGAGVTLQTDKKGAVLVLRGPRFRVTSQALHMRFKRIPIEQVVNARLEIHKAHWPAPNWFAALAGGMVIFLGIFGMAETVAVAVALLSLALGSLELRLAPTPFAVADIQGKSKRLLKCANEGEAKLAILAIREAQRIAKEANYGCD